MVNSVKIKTGSDLDILLRHPEQLATLIKITLGQEVDDNCLDVIELKSRGFITDAGVKSTLISTNVKRVKELSILNMKLKDVQPIQIPEDMQEYYKIALSFHGLIESNLLNIRARTNHLAGATVKKWVTPIRLMMENDNVTQDELREIWAFLKGHEFWSANIQSTEKLRKQFSTLYSQLKANEKRQTNTSKQNGGARTVSTDYLDRIHKDLQSE